MHLRRAVLLFAIVLGLAALAASISQPRDQQAQEPATPTTPTATPAAERPEPTRATFAAGGKRETRRVDAGQPTQVIVKTREPGQVDIEDLGLTASAEPVTPARFDVLPSDPGRHEVRFTPAASSRSELVGILKVNKPVG